MGRGLVASLAALACLAALGVASVARADASPDEKRARDAYERGSAAYVRADYLTAAKEFALADALAPNATALRAALDAAVLADDPVIGEALLERAHGRPRTVDLEKLVRTAETRFARRTGRVRVACGATPCLVAIDGAALDPNGPGFVRVGAHAVTVQTARGTEQRLLEVHADEEITIAPAPVPSPSPAPARGGISPVWFYAGAALTLGGGVATTLLALDTKSKHDAFVRAGCDRAPLPGCGQAASDGSSAQTRTNVVLGATVVLLVATAAVGLFAVKWRDDAPPAAVSLAALPGGAAASLHVSFR